MQLDDQMGGRHYPASFLICQSKYIKEKSIIQGLKEKKLKYIGVRIMVKWLNSPFHGRLSFWGRWQNYHDIKVGGPKFKLWLCSISH